jgi:hypothetical protein
LDHLKQSLSLSPQAAARREVKKAKWEKSRQRHFSLLPGSTASQLWMTVVLLTVTP